MKGLIFKFGNLSLKSKLGFLAMITSSITAFLMYIIFSVYSVSFSIDSVKNEIVLLADVIGDRNIGFLLFDDEIESKKSLSILKLKESIELACLYKKGGKVLSSYMKDPSGKLSCPKEPEIEENYFSWDGFVFHRPITKDSSTEGRIYLKGNMRSYQKQMLRTLSYITIITFFVLLLAYFLAQKIRLFIVKPLQELEKAALNVSKGDYESNAKKYYNDEIGILIDLFNSMLKQINLQDKKLKSANLNLEQKVKERTSDLEKAMNDLQDALKVKENFISNMSHEIRTPSHAMLNMGEFVRNDFRDIFAIIEEDPSQTPSEGIMEKLVEGQDFSEKFLAAARRQAELLGNVIDLKKMAEGKMSYEIKEHDFVAMAQASRDSYYEQERLITDFPSHPIMVKCDHSQVKRVIDNFISNALKYAPEGDIIMHVKESYYTDKKGNKKKAAHFSLEDRGVGVPPDELEHIFGTFNESSHTKNKAGGKGLGLAICDEVIKAHNGKIWAENNKNEKGSTFHFILPI